MATLEQLQAVAPYERAYPFANYLRGLVYLGMKEGPEAAAEFQKILDHPGSNWLHESPERTKLCWLY